MSLSSFIEFIVNNIFGATNVDSIYVSSLANTWTITVTYEDLFESTFGPEVKNEEEPGETVYSITELTEDDVDIPLDTIIDLFAYYESGGGIPIELEFTVAPNPLNPGGFWIYFTLPGAIPIGDDVVIIATGTQFSGSVTVGYIFAELVDGSGLYRLDFDKHYDTYYDRSIEPVETVDVTITSPFGRNGFF